VGQSGAHFGPPGPAASRPLPGHQPLPRYFTREIDALLSFAGDPRLAAAVGINVADLRDSETTIPLSVYYDLLERAAAVTGDPHFGLHFAVHWHEVLRHDHGAIGFLMRSSPNLRVMWDRVISFQRYWNAGDAYEVAERDDEFRLRYRSWGPGREAQRHMAEKAAAGIVAFVRDLEPECWPLSVRFPHGPMGEPSELRRVLGVAPTYGAASTEVVLPLDVVDKPMATANAALFRLCEHYLTMRLPPLPADEPHYTARVRDAVRRALPEGGISQEMIARRLGCGPRALQRRLEAEGVTLRKIVDEERRALAGVLLASQMSITEVAFLLHYSEPAAFQHAFRRWYGLSPKAWRDAVSNSTGVGAPREAPQARRVRPRVT
jgi:AraC-like DNA-binding protein